MPKPAWDYELIWSSPAVHYAGRQLACSHLAHVPAGAAVPLRGSSGIAVANCTALQQAALVLLL